MAKKISLTQEQLSRCRAAVRNFTNLLEYRKGLAGIILSQNRYSACELAEIMGVTERTLREDLAKIRKPEIQATGKRGGARHCLMTFAAEEQFLNEHLGEAAEGPRPGMPELHSKFNKVTGKDVPRSTFYRMLKRHGWRKITSSPGKGGPGIKAEGARPAAAKKIMWVKIKTGRSSA